jgi:hypothetical protein
MSCANTEPVAVAEKTVSVEPSAAGLYLGHGIEEQGSFAVNGKKGLPRGFLHKPCSSLLEVFKC